MGISTFASTLRTFLRDRWAEARFLRDPKDPEFGDLGQLVLAYWKALESLMPDAFADIAHYSVQRPIGVYVFHEPLPDIAEYCRMNADWSQKSFTEQLSRLQEWVEADGHGSPAPGRTRSPGPERRSVTLSVAQDHAPPVSDRRGIVRVGTGAHQGSAPPYKARCRFGSMALAANSGSSMTVRPACSSSSHPWQSATNRLGSRHAVTTRRIPDSRMSWVQVRGP